MLQSNALKGLMFVTILSASSTSLVGDHRGSLTPATIN